MLSRTPAAILLAALVATVLPGRPALLGQDPKKEPDKEPSREPTKLPEPKWPTEIGGKSMDAWIKDVTHPDPAIRQAALRTLPSFGPAVQKPVGKLLIARMKSTGERDPGVRLTLLSTVGTIGFDNAGEEKEALLLLGTAIDTARDGSTTRLHAVQAIAAFGPKAYSTVNYVAGTAAADSAYETRQAIANTLARIGFSETLGPNQKALVTLSGTLARDVSVAVRMEALQSLVLLGPPWAAKRPPGDKNPPVIDQVGADVVANNMRYRLGVGPGKAVAGGKEMDRQLEIWCRVVLMRFDEREITPQNLDEIGKHLDPDPKAELGPKLQALQALALFGERAAGQLDNVLKVINDGDPLVVNTAMGCLGSMGVKAQGALNDLQKLEKKWEKLREERLAENLKDKKFTEFYTKLEPKEREQVVSSLQEEQTRKTVADTVKWITASREGKPGGDLADPPKKEPEKK